MTCQCCPPFTCPYCGIGPTGPTGAQGPAGATGAQGATGAEGESAYQIARDNGFTGTQAQWLESLKGATGPAGPFRSSFIEALGNEQTIGIDEDIVFDPASVDDVGGCIELDASGKQFTINHTGLYEIEWNINLAQATSLAVVGIAENGLGASGASCTSPGSFSSGTLINVENVPFYISLRNYQNEITIANPVQWVDSAASIRIFRFADAPSV